MEIYFIDEQLKKFLDNLEIPAHAKAFRAIQLLQQFGEELRMPHAKKIISNLFELRITGRQEVRIFYTFHHHCAYLLHGYIKKSQQTPLKEIKTALGKRIASI